MPEYTIHCGDCLDVLRTLESGSVHCCVTSPPYWGLRDYGVAGQLGLEKTPDEYVAKMVSVFREVRRVLRDDGTCWVNLGDSYATPKQGNTQSSIVGKHNLLNAMSFKKELPPGLKPKDLVGIPWRVAFALQADGWYLRQDIVWHKPNPMPESVRDRCTKAHEYVFLLTKNARYYWDADAVAEDSVDKASYKPRTPRSPDKREGNRFFATKVGNNAVGKTYPTRNRRDVWTIATRSYKGAHFATMPPKLVEPCILAGCPVDGLVLDPFNGSGTTGAVAIEHGRRYVGIELNPEYIKLTHDRIAAVQPNLAV